MTVCRAAILFITSLLCNVVVAAEVPADDFRQRMRPCEACHGREGRPAADGYYPRIAGKPAGYLYEQLLNFDWQAGKWVAGMAKLAKMVDDRTVEYAG